MFTPVPPDIDFVALEQDELARWAAHRVFERSIEQREGAAPWVFYEGPPTANGMPGLHHVWARVYKDLFCRFRTMNGSYVARRAGWDTHGLPVEVEVEKKLGITGKEQIESQVGIAEFTRLCRESVYSYVDEFARLTTRIGYWVDMDAAYWTLDSSYIESVWWHLQQLFDQGLLYEDLKVVPYCPRCGTALSSHELGQPDVYRDEEDESAYVRFRLVDPAGAVAAAVGGGAEWLGVWTTTPWTLLSNTGVAVNPDLVYAVVDGVVMADDLVDAVMGEGASARVTARVPGSALVGLRYERPFDDVAVPPGADGWRVVPASYVTTEEGTGLVHLAPAFGEIDRQIGRENGLPSLNPVGPDGTFTDAVGWLAGRQVREANHDINDRLESAGLLLRRFPYVHSYPHCWRCRTPLIYWGKPSWYIATSTRKADLLAANQTVDWHPAYIKDGRFGEWLENNVDWALSRDRFWGTPLPIWRCGRGHVRCVGSLAELSDLCGRDVTGIDPHRPTIDDVTFPAGRVRRDVGAGRRGGRAGGVPPGRAGDRRLVRLGLHAGRPGGLSARRRVGGGLRLPGRLHLRGHRPDAGLVLLAAGHQHPGLRREPVPPRRLPRSHRRRRRPQDVQVARQHHRPLVDPRHPGRRRHALVDVLAGVALDADAGDARRHRHGNAGHAAHAVEHVQLLHDVRVAERVRSRRCGDPGGGGAGTAGSLGPVPAGQHDGDGRPKR